MAKFEKEGVQAAIDFIKYIVAVAGGAIAFAVQPSFYETSLLIRVLASFGSALLAMSIVAGILAHSAGCLKLARAEYDPDDIYFRAPGIVMLVTFGFGFIFVMAGVFAKVWG